MARLVEPAARPAKIGAGPANLVIAFFLVVSVGGWISYAATNGRTDTWGWMVVAGLGLIAAIVTGVLAGPE